MVVVVIIISGVVGRGRCLVSRQFVFACEYVNPERASDDVYIAPLDVDDVEADVTRGVAALDGTPSAVVWFPVAAHLDAKCSCVRFLKKITICILFSLNRIRLIIIINLRFKM